MNLFNFYFNKPFRLLDHTKVKTIFATKNDAMASFAIDDAIVTAVGEGEVPPTIRLWVHDKTLVLGIPDARLPHLKEGIEYIDDLGYYVIVRNSGGLAVLLDYHILNISFILPDTRNISIDQGYELMYQFIQALFRPDTKNIAAYEIIGSYCPGDYDLSIDGKKFAGISQRRVRKGVSIQAYIDISGKGKDRAQIVKQFYKRAKGKTQTPFHYPEVKPDVMASINDLLHTSYSVQTMIERLKHNVNSSNKNELTSIEEALFKQRYLQMVKRNERIAPYLKAHR